jgi:hypothetical protein
MSRDRILNILSFVLSSILVFVILDTFYAVILLVFDLLWLFYWLSLSESKKSTKIDISKKTIWLSVALLLSVGLYLNHLDSIQLSTLATQDLLALFPLILLLQLGFQEGEDA